MTDLTRMLSTSGLVPLASPKLTSLDGFVGVFTPIAQQGAVTADATENLQEIVARLTAEVGVLQQKNIEMQSRLDRTLARPTSSDDLASALQRTVNRLQTELASLSNPVSNFAVKDFRLETSLTVAVTELGTIEFRLLQPGANVDPSTISKLTLSLVPFEKQRAFGTFTSSLFEPEKELTAIGVSEPLRQVLERNHIFTIGEFRAAAMRAQVRTSLLAASVTTQAEMARLQARAELMLLAGVDRAIADQLIDANIDSLRALASCSPEGLALVLPSIDPARLSRWIEGAKAFDDGATRDPQRVFSLATDPDGLLVHHGDGAFLPTPLVRQVAADEIVALHTLRTQLHRGIAYSFDRWSTGAESTSIKLPAKENIAAGAEFRVAGFWVSAATESEGGKVVTSPAVGQVAGHSPMCHALGSEIAIVATPEQGYAVRGVTIVANGTTKTVTTKKTAHVVQSPVRVTATFMARPAVIPSVTPPSPTDDVLFQSFVAFNSSEPPVPGFDVRVTAVRFETTSGTGTVTLRNQIPIAFGDLPVARSTRKSPLVYELPATVATFNIHLTVQLKNATGDVFKDQHSIGHRNPNATGTA